MNKLSTLRFWYLRWFSKPAGDRLLYKAISKLKPQSIVQIGLESALQAQQIIAVAQRATNQVAIKYTGIDMFEARGAGGPLLKDTHKLLTATEAKVRLLPGDAQQTLPRMANQLLGTELLIISCDSPRESLDACWFFVPRMLTERSLLLLQCGRKGGASFETLRLADVEALAKAAGRSASKAA